MGAYYETIPPSLLTWILAQHLFYVASAPLSSNGHINVSPKGGAYFGLLGRTQFWYQELTGSGNETISHIHEPSNARICIMFNAFDGPPKIIRLWGHGRVLENGSPEFDKFVADRNQEVKDGKENSRGIEVIPGTRSIIIVDIEQVGSSCGFSVPYYEFKGHRDILNNHFDKKMQKFGETGDVKDGMDTYWAYKNAWSMDGLPGMKRGTWAAGEYKVAPIKKMVGPLGEKLAYSSASTTGRQFTLIQLLLAILLAMIAGELAATRGVGFLANLQQTFLANDASSAGSTNYSMPAWVDGLKAAVSK